MGFKLFKKVPPSIGGPLFLIQGRLNYSADIRPSQSHHARSREFAGECVANQYAGCFPRKAASIGKTCVCQCSCTYIEGQPMRHVSRTKRRARHPKGDPVEFITFNDCTLKSVRSIRLGTIG